ncbi:MAG: CIA30 family protein [Pseudomonadota bacterium]
MVLKDGPGVDTTLIDDFSDPTRARNGQSWRFFSDRVMGGVSLGTAEHETVDGRPALRLTGDVSLENNGGFIQVALDLTAEGRTLDASAFTGVELTLRGDGADYAVNLRTSDLRYPWQSYRAAVASAASWTTHRVPFAAFLAQRTDHPLNPARLRRIGLIAIGEARRVDVAITELRFFH